MPRPRPVRPLRSHPDHKPDPPVSIVTPKISASLLKMPEKQVQDDLGRIREAIAAAFPLKPRHQQDLPPAIQSLSFRLTRERGQIRRYWEQPRLLGAYLHYFLPWNLVRLAWLLPNLPLRLTPGDLVLDLGSGPLTFPLGIWLARPEMRRLPLRIFCADDTPRPLALGMDILKKISGDSTLWETILLRDRLETVPARLPGPLRLITAGNVLNELSVPRHDNQEERLTRVFQVMHETLAPGGQILFLEPGTRLGGALISLLRGVALEYGYAVEAPCTHEAPCPLAEEGYSGWCHFSFPALGANPELIALTKAAGLDKDRLHLACLLIRKPLADPQKDLRPLPKNPAEEALDVRVISNPIRLPGEEAPARYVCSAHGLGLIHHALGLKSGQKTRAALWKKKPKDLKSNAWNMNPAE